MLDKLCRDLPEVSRDFLAIFMRHLKRVSENHQVNKMGLTNLQVVWCPTLGFGGCLFVCLILHCERFFPIGKVILIPGQSSNPKQPRKSSLASAKSDSQSKPSRQNQMPPSSLSNMEADTEIKDAVDRGRDYLDDDDPFGDYYPNSSKSKVKRNSSPDKGIDVGHDSLQIPSSGSDYIHVPKRKQSVGNIVPIDIPTRGASTAKQPDLLSKDKHVDKIPKSDDIGESKTIDPMPPKKPAKIRQRQTSLEKSKPSNPSDFTKNTELAESISFSKQTSEKNHKSNFGSLEEMREAPAPPIKTERILPPSNLLNLLSPATAIHSLSLRGSSSNLASQTANHQTYRNTSAAPNKFFPDYRSVAKQSSLNGSNSSLNERVDAENSEISPPKPPRNRH